MGKSYIKKVDFGRKIKESADEENIVKKYNIEAWLIESLSRLSTESIDTNSLSEEDRIFVTLADKYVEEKGGWLREVTKQIEMQNKIAQKQIEVNYDGTVVTNADRANDVNKNKNELTDEAVNKAKSDNDEAKGSLTRAFLMLVLGVLTFIFLKQWMTVGLDKIDHYLGIVPILWIVLLLLVSLANEDRLKKNGFEFIPKLIKYSFVVGILLFLISLILDFSGFWSHNFNGLSDNVRM